MPIYFIRHGQSEFNAVHNEGENDPLIFDAPLTDKGRRQAEEAKVLVSQSEPKDAGFKMNAEQVGKQQRYRQRRDDGVGGYDLDASLAPKHGKH